MALVLGGKMLLEKLSVLKIRGVASAHVVAPDFNPAASIMRRIKHGDYFTC
jgi:hypothetical protein